MLIFSVASLFHRKKAFHQQQTAWSTSERFSESFRSAFCFTLHSYTPLLKSGFCKANRSKTNSQFYVFDCFWLASLVTILIYIPSLSVCVCSYSDFLLNPYVEHGYSRFVVAFLLKITLFSLISLRKLIFRSIAMCSRILGRAFVFSSVHVLSWIGFVLLVRRLSLSVVQPIATREIVCATLHLRA